MEFGNRGSRSNITSGSGWSRSTKPNQTNKQDQPLGVLGEVSRDAVGHLHFGRLAYHAQRRHTCPRNLATMTVMWQHPQTHRGAQNRAGPEGDKNVGYRSYFSTSAETSCKGYSHVGIPVFTAACAACRRQKPKRSSNRPDVRGVPVQTKLADLISVQRDASPTICRCSK